MAELSRLFGIIIKMCYDDHNPPLFHAIYGVYSTIIGIKKILVIDRYLPPRARDLGTEWAYLHRQELFQAWESAIRYKDLKKIDPLT